MAKKKVKKKAGKKVAKKRVVRKVKRAKPRSAAKVSANKNEIVLKNFFMYVILFVVSLILYSVSGSVFYQSLFMMASILFGFVALALLIIILVFLFLKWARNK